MTRLQPCPECHRVGGHLMTCPEREAAFALSRSKSAARRLLADCGLTRERVLSIRHIEPRAFCVSPELEGVRLEEVIVRPAFEVQKNGRLRNTE